MESMERSKGPDRRSYTPELELEIADQCRAGDRSIPEVARDFDLTASAVRRWVAQAEIDAGERPGPTSEEREELFWLCADAHDDASIPRPLLGGLDHRHLLAHQLEEDLVLLQRRQEPLRASPGTIGPAGLFGHHPMVLHLSWRPADAA